MYRYNLWFYFSSPQTYTDNCKHFLAGQGGGYDQDVVGDLNGVGVDQGNHSQR